jgi:hypothetical protein
LKKQLRISIIASKIVVLRDQGLSCARGDVDGLSHAALSVGCRQNI